MEALKNLVIWDNTVIPSSVETVTRIGGKALGLHELKDLGIKVPGWATITASMFKKICASDNQMIQLLVQENIEPKEKAGLIRGHLKNITLDNRYQKTLSEVWNKISKGGKIEVGKYMVENKEDAKMLVFALSKTVKPSKRWFESMLDWSTEETQVSAELAAIPQGQESNKSN